MTGKDIQTEQSMQDLLKRMSREMDRFAVSLMQIENAGAELISLQDAPLSPEVAMQFQSLDYLRQVSSAISGMLDEIGAESPPSVDDVLAKVYPTDLRERLMDVGLDDIDNTSASFAIF